ncbi:hypothetical protein C7293_26900 [filamentous cyanobacterium CCT1]|nr:hypothetical protein C7293_26900 [filamentous cyanobacterium CCT1]PSN77217.1 hypothetical protein C8B47_23230 [filamentous cyanobacterium CCP4]
MAGLIKIEAPTHLEVGNESHNNGDLEQKKVHSSFELVVKNCSQRFASFQVDLSLEGASGGKNLPNKWYRVEPEVCAKKPPGAETTFNVVIDKAPIPAFGQILPLQVRVFSVEYKDLEATNFIQLKLCRPKSPIRVEFPFEDLKVYPGDRLKIPVIVLNLMPEPVDIGLSLIGETAAEADRNLVPEPATDLSLSDAAKKKPDATSATSLAYIQPEWFESGLEKQVLVPPGSSRIVEFCCCPPTSKPNLPLSQPYWFNLRAVFGDRALEAARQNHVVEVLPYGSVEVVCEKTHQNIAGVGWRDRVGKAEFKFDITNNSNLAQQVDVTIQAKAAAQTEPNTLAKSDDFPIPITTKAKPENRGDKLDKMPTENDTDIDKPQHLAERADVDADSYAFRENTPVEAIKRDSQAIAAPTQAKTKTNWADHKTIHQLLPGCHEQLSLSIQHSRPWLGWPHHYVYSALTTLSVAKAGITSAPIQPVPQQQTLTVEVKPILPGWLQIAGALASLLGIAAAWWLMPGTHHLAPVNSVQLIGNTTTVVSGSSDQTLRRWNVVEAPWQALRSRLLHRELIAETNKSIQVIEASPFRDSQIAVGLESGDIELWNVSPPQLIHEIFEGSDRIFDLAFTPDAHSLFSGHGSGQVREWNLQSAEFNLERQLATGVAIAALAVLQIDQRSVVAVGGQYNTLLLWNLDNGQAYQLKYAPFGTTADVQSQANYITSLATTKDSSLLAVADNRGYISLWPQEILSSCLNQQPNAPSSSQPNAFQPIPCQQEQAPPPPTFIHADGQGIRAIALSNDGCYLATADNSGQLLLWPITTSERGEKTLADSITIAHYPSTPIRTIDIEQVKQQELLIAANGPGNRVSIHRHRGSCGKRGS